MGLFNTLMSKIFSHPLASAAPASAPGSTTGSAAPGTPASAPAGTPASTAAATPASVDINAVLTDMAAKNSEHLDWKKSIVDLMKLVGMDSSLASRKELAKDLGYTGDMNDSASMNIWLHQEVMRKLAANGGKVPPDLLK